MSLGIVSTFLFLLGYMGTAMIFPLVTIHGNKCRGAFIKAICLP